MDKNTLFEDIVTKRSSASGTTGQYEKISLSTNLVALLDTMPHIVMILNQYRQIVWANHSLLTWLNIDNIHEVIGQRPGEVFDCVNAAASEYGCGSAKQCQVCGALLAILKSLNGNIAEEECMLLTTKNDTLNLRIKACPIDIEGERFDAVSVVDISDEKNKRMLERLFFHDMMNLAGSIQGFLDILPEQIKENTPALPETLAVLEDSAGDLIDLIKSQKDLLSAENNELSVYNKQINANKLLLTIRRFFQRNGSFQDRHINTRPIQDDMILVCDERILKRIITNAVKNALEAVGQGESVSLGYQAEDDAVVFEIHNHSYIPEDVQSRIFRKSFSTKSKDRGIGTYSIKLFTEKYLGGKAWFVSDKDRGTTFYIKIPKNL